MKKLTSMLFLSLIFTLTSVFSAQAADIKIGVIDTQKIISQSGKIMKYRSDFLKEMDKKKAELMEIQKSAQALDQELKDKNSKITDQERMEKNDKLNREARKYNRMKEEFELELQSRNAELGRKFLRQIKEIADEYLKSNKYTIILEKNALVASDNAVDVTDEIIKLYDSKN